MEQLSLYNVHLISSCLIVRQFISDDHFSPGIIRSIVGAATYDALQAFFALPVEHDKDFDLPEGV